MIAKGKSRVGEVKKTKNDDDENESNKNESDDDEEELEVSSIQLFVATADSNAIVWDVSEERASSEDANIKRTELSEELARILPLPFPVSYHTRIFFTPFSICNGLFVPPHTRALWKRFFVNIIIYVNYNFLEFQENI
jgi:hypothetical protein